MSNLLLGWSEDSLRQRMGFAMPHPAFARQLITDGGEGHAIVFAPTGKGKGRNVAIPNLLEYKGPVIALDLKGELAAVTAEQRRKAGQQVIIIDPWSITPGAETHAFNPQQILDNAGDDLVDRAYMLASMLRQPAYDAAFKDKFWEERAEALIAGLMAYFARYGQPHERTPGKIYSILNGDAVAKIAHLLDRIPESDWDEFPYMALSSFVSTTEVTRSGILSTAQSLTRVLAGARVRAALSRSDFDPDAIVNGDQLTIYLVVPPNRLTSHAPLLRLLISAFLALLLSRRQKPERPTLLVLDEAAQLGPMEQIRTAITLARGYGVRTMLFMQSYAQLRAHYHDHESIVENSGTILTFGNDKLSMAECLAQVLGGISAEQLLDMAPDQLAFRIPGQQTQMARRLDYLKDSLFAGKAAPNPMFRT